MPADQSSSGKRLPVGLMVAGSEMSSFTILGVIADLVLGTMPWITVIATLLGLVLAFFHLVKMSQALTAKKPEPPSSPAPPEGSGS